MDRLAPEDERMLRALLAEVEDDDEEQRFRVGPFRDMLARGRPLSDKQRSWLRSTYERVCGEPTYENLASSGRLCRGREVPTPTVLQNLPKKPPTRGVDDDDE
jgi:hypothetical protein